jgi:E3 ubiquitin-protein ligase HECTD3
MQSDLDEETFESTFPDQTYCIELTDGTIVDLIPNGSYEKVTYEDRFKFLELAVKARLSESNLQIAAVKKGLCKIIPYSLIKCK